MKLPVTFLTLLSLALVLSGCTPPEPQIIEKPVVRTEIVTPEIAIQNRPRPVTLNDVDFRVVTEENLEDFIAEVESREGAVVFIAISVEDYENLALNIEELRRYIRQQGALVVYYENAVTEAAKI